MGWDGIPGLWFWRFFVRYLDMMDGLMDGLMDGKGGICCILLQICIFAADFGGGLSERSIA